jgi:dUTP pyrophosphatase
LNIIFEKTSLSAVKPTKQHPQDAGYDLYSTHRVVINPMERAVVPTGIIAQIPEGYYGRIAPRSGLAIRNGAGILAGVIDSGYAGEIGVVLVNLNLPVSLLNPSKKIAAFENMFGQKGKIEINPGDRVAQIIIEKCYDVTWTESTETKQSERGEGGFGSSGI